MGKLVYCEAKGRLEAEIPDELAKVVLSRLRVTLYLSDDGWVRSCAHSERDKQLSPLDVLNFMAARLWKTFWSMALSTSAGAANGCFPVAGSAFVTTRRADLHCIDRAVVTTLTR